MVNNRRRFLRTAGWVAGAAALGGFPLMASAPPASAAERKVSAVISRYGNCVKIRHNVDHTTEFTVRVHSLRRFSKVFDPRRLPFERIHVGPGNTLRFKHHGSEFTIVNLV